MDRRSFIGAAGVATAAAMLGDWEKLLARGAADPAVGKTWKGWRKGRFQVHFIYTGTSESMFIIMPDGTSMLLDCGDHDPANPLPLLPGPERRGGEWIARYVLKVNPRGRDVDYMMLSHYHTDHAGSLGVGLDEVFPDGRTRHLSGFSHAAEWLDFKHGIDRQWPSYDEPFPMTDDKKKCFSHMRAFYDYMTRERGMQMERFRVGQTGQIALRHRPDAYRDFNVHNICGNGYVADADGNLIDLYAARKPVSGRFSENGMSLGLVFTYGAFKFYTAGDFSNEWQDDDGSMFNIEEKLAQVVEPCQVAKLNHHGFHSMPAALVAALRSRVWVNCVWNTRHTTSDTLERLGDRSLYPGPRVVCPTLFPSGRTGEAPVADTIAKAAFDGGHMVLDVPRGGRSYSISYLSAADESLTVRSVLNFRS